MAVKLIEDGRSAGYDEDGDDDDDKEEMTIVEFGGPEQLVARLLMIWDDWVDQGVKE
jgi:hypothetical protein